MELSWTIKLRIAAVIAVGIILIGVLAWQIIEPSQPPLRVVSLFDGHLGISTTRKYYLAVRPEDLASANKFLNKVLAKLKAN